MTSEDLLPVPDRFSKVEDLKAKLEKVLTAALDSLHFAKRELSAQKCVPKEDLDVLSRRISLVSDTIKELKGQDDE